MGDRIKALRQYLGLSQTEFGTRIGVTQNYIWMIESEKRIPSDRTIADICRVFGVSESWIRDGVGEMIPNKTREEELGQLVRRLLDRPDSFCTRLVSVLARFDPDDPRWSLLEEIVDQVAAEQKKEADP